jgi:hypothetical protein
VLYVSAAVHQILRDERKRTDKSIEEIAADFVTANATVEEVAKLAGAVVSPLASATTGAALRVEGGVVARIAQRKRRSGRAAAGSVDSNLSQSHSLFELHWADVADRREHVIFDQASHPDLVA